MKKKAWAIVLKQDGKVNADIYGHYPIYKRRVDALKEMYSRFYNGTGKNCIEKVIRITLSV